MSGLFIDIQGRGPQPLVLVHGWAMHGGVFEALTQALAERCTLYLVDLPGHGRAYRREGSQAPMDEVVRAIVEATPPAPWVGWSLGGQLCLHAALRHRDHVRGLGMLCASPCFTRRDDWPHGVAADVFAGFAATLEEDLAGTLKRFIGQIAMGDAQPRSSLRRLKSLLDAWPAPDRLALAQGLAMLESGDLRAQIGRFAGRSVWIGARHDRLVPWQAMAAGADICGGHFACIESSGHAPFLGQAGAVAAALHPLLAPETA